MGFLYIQTKNINYISLNFLFIKFQSTCIYFGFPLMIFFPFGITYIVVRYAKNRD